jgi:uncharacterized protein
MQYWQRVHAMDISPEGKEYAKNQYAIHAENQKRAYEAAVNEYQYLRQRYDTDLEAHQKSERERPQRALEQQLKRTELERLQQEVEAQKLSRDWKPGSPQVARRESKVAPPPPTARNKVTSTGTGFFVSEIGHILTNAHVVDGCQTVRSSRGGAVRKVSTDEASDLALYIASEKPSAVARLRGGRGARAGEPVVAVGFPLSGLLSSDLSSDLNVTTGIISALSGLRNDRGTIQVTAETTSSRPYLPTPNRVLHIHTAITWTGS